MDHDESRSRLAKLADMEKLSDTLADRDGGELFASDLQEARQLAEVDARFQPLAAGLEAPTLGQRLAAVDRFFKSMPPEELATLVLPTHLNQLRSIFLSSR